MQKDMLEALNNEGFQINDRELMRLRLRFKWLLRDSTGRVGKKKNEGGNNSQSSQRVKKQRVGEDRGLIDQLADAILQERDSSEEESGQGSTVEAQPGPKRSSNEPQPQSQNLDPAETLRRQLRQEQLRQESDEKWRTRKRRRRTRGWAGLPADAPGEPPRFPSETTLDESKAYLSLDNQLYRQVREQFQAMCEEQGVVKKTIAGPEKWGQLLQQLIRENTHLSTVFQQEPEVLEQGSALWRPKNYKALSLDVICMDVTKRLRTMESRMGIPEAKNILGLNPEESRQVRSAFYTKLKEDHFTSKLQAGDQHWNELKQEWVQESELLTRILAAGDSDPKHIEKLKAIEILARDVMKRLRNENSLSNPEKSKKSHQGPGPGPAPPSALAHASTSHAKSRHRTGTRSAGQAGSDLPSLSASSDLQIDPSLLLAASDAAVIPHIPHEPSFQHSQAHHGTEQGSYESATSQVFGNAPLPIYFRLHSLSNTSIPNKTVWLSILQSTSVSEIKNLAMREHPGTTVVKLEGLIVHKYPGQPDREVMITIDDEDELRAYLGHVGGGKATFVVLLGLGQGGGYV
ncbi:hypothetical protein BS50DRAFT_573862 [Corynespora cassiicola Philippines]|uniref:Clr5 domain-containing protein n=1 Tax=Corynespora cassiicola Philippines TaxID=1448308 RepID=A0A2T2NP11_CORCC|nr:hypothetical protein BS50DRAFT_573862 [Corynespora cassiicola Philippines]